MIWEGVDADGVQHQRQSELSSLTLADQWGFAVGSIGAAAHQSGGGDTQQRIRKAASNAAGPRPESAATTAGRQALRSASRPKQKHKQLQQRPHASSTSSGGEGGDSLVLDQQWPENSGALTSSRPTSAVSLSYAREQWADNLLRIADHQALAGEGVAGGADSGALQHSTLAAAAPCIPHRCSTAPVGSTRSSRLRSAPCIPARRPSNAGLIRPSNSGRKEQHLQESDQPPAETSPSPPPPASSSQNQQRQRQRPVSCGGTSFGRQTTRAEAARGLRVANGAVAVRVTEGELLYDPDHSVLAHIHRAPAVKLPPNLAALSRKWAKAAALAAMQAL